MTIVFTQPAMLDDLRGRWLGTPSATHGHPAWPIGYLCSQRDARSVGLPFCAARDGTWQIVRSQSRCRSTDVAGQVALILVKRLTKSEASCTASGPRLIYMSIMSRISSFETCFKIRLAWDALFKHPFQQYKGSGGCITQTYLSIASARCICSSYAVNRYDHPLSSSSTPLPGQVLG
jgi:hypothetical protein